MKGEFMSREFYKFLHPRFFALAQKEGVNSASRSPFVPRLARASGSRGVIYLQILLTGQSLPIGGLGITLISFASI